jgi:hypothetical protein
MTTGRTCEGDLGSRPHARSTWFLAGFAALGKNSSAKDHSPFLHKGIQIAGGRDRETDPAQMGLAITKDRKACTFIGCEGCHEIERSVLGCVVEACDQLVENTGTIVRQTI